MYQVEGRKGIALASTDGVCSVMASTGDCESPRAVSNTVRHPKLYSQDGHLITHCAIGTIGLDSEWGKISSAAYFVRKFVKYKNDGEKVRLGIWNPEIKQLKIIKTS